MAILLDEPDSQQHADTIATAPRCLMSVATYLEAAIVAEGRGGSRAAGMLDRLLERARVELAPVTVEQAQAARDAWRRYGRRNHPAALNFGDCFSYALAKTTGEPLLYKGNDFALTDIEAALDP